MDLKPDRIARSRRATRIVAWTLLLCGALPPQALAAPDEEPQRHLLFLVDRSRSMTSATEDGQQRPWSFAEALERARKKVVTELNAYSDRDDVAVSFWSFGRQNHHARLSDATALTPAEAIESVEGLFTEDPDFYSHQSTYIAYSIFRIVKEELELPDLTPDDDIPRSASRFYACVFTDGRENVVQGFDNSPYERWVERQERLLQLRFERCDIYTPPPPEECTGGIDEDQDGLTDCEDDDCADHPACEEPPPPPDDHVVYDVIQGEPTLAATIDPKAVRESDDARFDVEPPRVVRLVPRGYGARPEDIEEAARCPGSSQGPATGVGPTELLVQAAVQWPDNIGDEATSEWRIEGPPRGVRAGDPDGLGTRPLVDRQTLRLRIAGPTRVVLPGEEIPDGRYPLRFVKKSLCPELRRAYPNSSFAFPREADDSLARLGEVFVGRVKRYPFTVTGGDGAPPDQDLPVSEADVWHRYTQGQRRFTVKAPDGVEAEIDYRLTVHRDGEPLTDPGGLATLYARTKAETGHHLTAPPGDHVHVLAPASDAPWHERAFGMGFDPPPGEYTLHVTVEPDITEAEAEDYVVEVVCPDCDAATSNGPRLTLPLKLRVAEPPIWWLWWFLGAIALLILAYATFRWVTRPRFPKGLVLGIPEDGKSLRSAHESGAAGKKALFYRRPLYVELLASGDTSASRKLFAARESGFFHRLAKRLGVGGAGEEPSIHGDVVALRPSPDNPGNLLVWSASRSQPAGGGEVRLNLGGRPLPHHEGDGVPAVDGVQVIDWRDATRKRHEVVRQVMDPKGGVRDEDRYPFEDRS